MLIPFSKCSSTKDLNKEGIKRHKGRYNVAPLSSFHQTFHAPLILVRIVPQHGCHAINNRSFINKTFLISSVKINVFFLKIQFYSNLYSM